MDIGTAVVLCTAIIVSGGLITVLMLMLFGHAAAKKRDQKNVSYFPPSGSKPRAVDPFHPSVRGKDRNR